ncbi:MAG: NfeD family protein [Lachnospiraceae bacterium]|jgi:membrane protein implicated in regulation of membrane protease activity|uniref:NfeD family protein n=1 Tax=Candidatus Merdisoma sp. JLR.KK011 TaxID=3114299 RepID=UPI0029DBAC1F|nr:NfeD family protein [Lachnospiraceae bacterium]MCI9624826.1 NfeD family protein [Lachnospiraceae bacterium]
MNAIYWLILFIVLLVIEIITLGLTTIWFAGGALTAFVLSMLEVSPAVQWAVFCAVSLILLFATRPWAVRCFNNQKKEKTNVDSLIGRTAVVTSEIRNLEGKGEVFVNGLTWTARAGEDSLVIKEDTHVTITAVQGVKLIVEVKN